ncbi:hypothetical protein [Nocardia asiatica]
MELPLGHPDAAASRSKQDFSMFDNQSSHSERPRSRARDRAETAADAAIRPLDRGRPEHERSARRRGFEDG